MKKYIVTETQIKKIVDRMLTEQSEGNDIKSLLPDELKDNEDAISIMMSIIELLDKLNNIDIDQSENGVSEKMRNIAIHMIEANV